MKYLVESNLKNLILQTGSKQNVSISLYKAMGYERIENYEPYINYSNSICMGK